MHTHMYTQEFANVAVTDPGQTCQMVRVPSELVASGSPLCACACVLVCLFVCVSVCLCLSVSVCVCVCVCV